MRLSNKAIIQVAKDIEPFANKIIERDDMLTDTQITLLSRRHAQHTVSSKRSTMMVLDYLCA
jgi:hypothetical protein